MPDPFESTPASGVEKPTKPNKTKQRARRVLLIDSSDALRPLLEQSQVEHGQVEVVYAATIKSARKVAKEAGKIDLALIPQAGDGSGLDLARELKANDPAIATVTLTDTPDFTLAQQAMQIGASDIIIKPVKDNIDEAWLKSTAQRIGAVLDRQWVERVRSTLFVQMAS